MKDDLLDLYLRDPGAARGEADRILATPEATDEERAHADRVLGVWARDNGDATSALVHLRRARKSALIARSEQLAADIRATLGATLVVTGNARQGLIELGGAIESARDLIRVTALYRRGVCHAILGMSKKAIADLEQSADLARQLKATSWLARSLSVLAEEQMRMGQLADAEQALREATDLLTADGKSQDSVRLQAMLAKLLFLRGDLPASIAEYNDIDTDLVADGRLHASIAFARAAVFLASGMPDVAAENLADLDTQSVPSTDVAECQALVAEALLSTNDVGRALRLAADATADLRRLGSTLYADQCALVTLLARREMAEDSLESTEVYDLASRLREAASPRAVDAWVLAGQVDHGQASEAAFGVAASYRAHSDNLIRAAGWYGLANQRSLSATPGVLRACGHGLAALDEYRECMGSSELRATATRRGRDLAEFALRHAAGDPRTLLAWSERWRATSLAQPPVVPQGDISPALAVLRDSGRRIAEARAAGESTVALEKERRSLERKVRAEHHQQRAGQTEKTKKFEPAELVAQVGDGAFVELVDVDGILHVLVVSRGRVRRVIAGETKAALELAEAGRFALRRAARTQRFAPGDLGQRFQEAVLGKVVRMLPDGPVTISPTAALHGAPFALMPTLKDRPFSLVPSAAQWMRATAVPKPRTKRRALVSGPGLLTGGAEVIRLAAEYPEATVLRDEHATVEATMKAIDGATLAHLATHGTFRADSPLFSALELADGQLSVYELERLKRAPYRTILSACDSGVLAPVGAQEVLGLASALFSLGSAGLVCSIAEVNDEVTADLMMEIHASLDANRTPAEALAHVRATAGPVELATAAAFVALGV